MYNMVYGLQFFLGISLVTCDNKDYQTELNDYFSEETFENDDNNEVISKTELSGRNGLNETLENIEQKYESLSIKVVNSTTETNKCAYQENMDNEESDEYSTLINYPFSVSIQRKGAHYATGALVNKRWILTVAREFYNVRESIKLFRARLGSVDCKRGGTVLPLKGLEIHPSYVYGKPKFDLALLRLAKPVIFTNFIKSIKLSKIRAEIINAKFMTTYWPRIVIDGGKVLPESATERIKYNSMRVSTQRMIPWKECKTKLKLLNETLHDSSLCLKPVKTHHSVCMPDVGAPVVAEDGLWGITSGWTSSKCPTNPGPTIFTRLSSRPVKTWLEANLLNV